ncbi:MAG: hypothetical protein EHM57_04180 [Actinobacteria bacterium]|nr:MAG: hypothetical protein EHM57_04180 [Actinomycetota bacterium]
MAASANHAHLQRVYAAGDGDGVYSISEWDGAVSVADRLAAAETVPVDEFLPNAAGLASGLAALHAAGGLHGAIDESTIHYSAAHPAKLGGWGRARRGEDPADDTRSLADALRTAITGSTSPSVKPSHVAEGLSAEVDAALDAAADGRLTASGLADALRAAPYRPLERTEKPFRWRWTLAFAAIVAAIVGIAAAGLAIDVDPDSPFLFPATGADRPTSTPAAPPVVDEQPGGVGLPATVAVFDPLGDGVENDELLPALFDGDPATAWVTEPYSEPLPQIKAGVGLLFEVNGDPAGIQITGTPTTRFELAWAETAGAMDSFEASGSGTLLDAATRMQLPARSGGSWLLWIVDVPQNEDGSFQAAISGVRFLP